MYTVISFDNITEMYKLKEYNEQVKDALEYLNTYGEDSIEFVFKGEIIENNVHEEYTLESMIKRFEECEFFESYCNEFERELMEDYKRLLRKIEIK